LQAFANDLIETGREQVAQFITRIDALKDGLANGDPAAYRDLGVVVGKAAADRLTGSAGSVAAVVIGGTRRARTNVDALAAERNTAVESDRSVNRDDGDRRLDGASDDGDGAVEADARLSENAEDQQPNQDPVRRRTDDGTARTTPGASNPGSYDPNARVRDTVSARDADKVYTPGNVQEALDRAPQNEYGQPVDHRNGRPLLLENIDGNRGWIMRWDPEGNSWVAENRSLTEHGLAARGKPGSFGYDENGYLLPYANYRPDYAPGQVEKVWNNSREAQLRAIDEGELPLGKPGENQMWVRARNDATGKDIVDLGVPQGRWRLIEWVPGQPRDGLWDMGHLTEQPYALLRREYLSGRIKQKDFLEMYRSPQNYRVEDPDRNRARDDEVSLR